MEENGKLKIGRETRIDARPLLSFAKIKGKKKKEKKNEAWKKRKKKSPLRGAFRAVYAVSGMGQAAAEDLRRRRRPRGGKARRAMRYPLKRRGDGRLFRSDRAGEGDPLHAFGDIP